MSVAAWDKYVTNSCPLVPRLGSNNVIHTLWPQLVSIMLFDPWFFFTLCTWTKAVFQQSLACTVSSQTSPESILACSPHYRNERSFMAMHPIDMLVTWGCCGYETSGRKMRRFLATQICTELCVWSHAREFQDLGQSTKAQTDVRTCSCFRLCYFFLFFIPVPWHSS